MWKLNCGCGPVPEPIEFDIIENPSIYINSGIILPNKIDNYCCLIKKIIQEYLDIINKLECGIQPDLENLLQEISLIEIKDNKNFYITKKIYDSNVDTELKINVKPCF